MQYPRSNYYTKQFYKGYIDVMVRAVTEVSISRLNPREGDNNNL